MRHTGLYATVAVMALACGGTSDGGSDPAVEAGRAVYENPVEDGNTFACATCHALQEPARDYRRPGHPIGDATRRPSYKNGQLPEMRDAVASCLVEWMNAEPWAEDDRRWLDLHAFLDGQAELDEAPALSFELAPVPADLTGGDAAAGRALFDGSCAVCHGEDGQGTERALPVGGRGLDPTYVATRVRTSGRSDSAVYPGLTGGVMPFWARDRLSDDELRDIAAYLALGGAGGEGTGESSGEAGSSGEDSGDGSGGGSEGGPLNCAATHPRVGATAVLVEKFHDVGGTAEIVDDCTIVIQDFTYDGAGIDVRVYGGLGGDYDAGFAISDDLVMAGGYDGVTLELVLPEGRTLDDLDGISVWCVDVGVDFGSGMFVQ